MKKYLFLFALVSVLSNPSFGQKEYKKGYYYDMVGQKHEGLILYKYGYQPVIRYKFNEETKPKKIKAIDTEGFVLQTDSFTVITNFLLLRAVGSIDYDFAQVLEVGPIILLKNYSAISSGGGNLYGSSTSAVETYLLRKPGEYDLRTVFIKKKKFTPMIEEIISDFPENSKYRDLDALNYDMVPEIIAEYNKIHSDP